MNARQVYIFLESGFSNLQETLIVPIKLLKTFKGNLVLGPTQELLAPKANLRLNSSLCFHQVWKVAHSARVWLLKEHINSTSSCQYHQHNRPRGHPELASPCHRSVEPCRVCMHMYAYAHVHICSKLQLKFKDPFST